ncbi:hypothetical protein SLS62_000705 [Diatrype stigma]|uniref:AA1-like domain-containing protein n=1 Tax=Diatrype stigma TaxID=117547 RepID=A0AAN9V0Y7_9PEZI
MRFTIAAAVAFFGATAFAASEDVRIASFSVSKGETDGALQNASFKLSGNEATDLDCSADLAGKTLPTEDFTCGTSTYRFALDKGDSTDFALVINHESAEGRLQGRGDAVTYCHAGGAANLLCTQQNDITITVADTAVGK